MSSIRCIVASGMRVLGVTVVTTVITFASSVGAAALTWDGGAGTLNYRDAANWTEDRIPDLNGGTDTAMLSGAHVTYTPGGDWLNNSTFTMTGPNTSWTQVDGGSWIKMGRSTNGMPVAGTLNILDGAVFNTGTAGNFLAGNGGYAVINVSGGTFNAATSVSLTGVNSSITVTNSGIVTLKTLSWSQGTISVDNGGVLTITEGTVSIGVDRGISLSGSNSEINLTGQFKPTGGLVSISGGTLNASHISFDSVDTSLLFSGGRINLSNGQHFHGVFRSGTERYIDFIGDGVLFLGDNATATNANALIGDGRLRYFGVQDPTKFIVTEVTGGVEITVVPEPTSLSLLALGSFALLRRRR